MSASSASRPEQLSLALTCPSCGSETHHGCGYDPETVAPAMSIFEALAQTFETMGYMPPVKPTGFTFWRVPS